MKNSRFHYWLFFGFILTVLPLLLACTYLYISRTDLNLTWWDMVKKVSAGGALHLVSLSLLGANLGDLFKDECSWPVLGLYLKAASIFLSFALMFFFCMVFVNPTTDNDSAFHLSIGFFIMGIIVCLISLFAPRK